MALAVQVQAREKTRIQGNTDGKPTAIFYVPHQDDELLSMGVGILHHLEVGYNVIVVLYTDGQGSSVLNQLKMTPEEFGEKRDREFRRSTKALGVLSKNIHYLNIPDSKVTKEDMRKIIMDYENLYPNAVHRAYSYYDLHNDHRVAGEALNELYNEERLNKDVKFYINYGKYETKGIEEPYKESYKEELMNGIKAYKTYYPRLGSYAIGWKSASPLFINLEKNPKSLYHLPNYID
nr:PIG-L family deacetylase [Metabacillus idriensis]